MKVEIGFDIELPKRVLDVKGWHEGDIVNIDVAENGNVIIYEDVQAGS